MKRSLPLSLLLALGFSLGAQEPSLIPPYERPRLAKGTHVALCAKSPRFKPAAGLQSGTFKMLLAENRFPELGKEGTELLNALGTKGSQQKLDLALTYVSQAEKVDAGGFAMVRMGEVVLEGKVTDPKGWVLATFIAHTTFGPGEGSWKPDRKVLEKVFAQITRELQLPAAQ